MSEAKYTIIVKDKILGSTNREFIYNHPDDLIEVKLESNDYSNNHRSNIRWDFGDGTILEAPSAEHYYKTAGVYSITATLYSINNKVENDIVLTKTVIVKELVPTELTFSDIENTWKNNIIKPISKNSYLGEIQISLGSNVITLPKISAVRRWPTEVKEPSYFDVKDTPYYHLQRYYTFLEETKTPSNAALSASTIVKPVDAFTPEYVSLYGYLTNENGQVVLKAYIVDFQERSINFKPYKTKEGDRFENFSIEFLNSINRLPENAAEIGKIGFVNIWYKNDFPVINDLIFEIDKETLFFKNESGNDASYLNIPHLGFTLETKNNNSNIELRKALTINGLYKESDDDTNSLRVDKYLENNFYKDYTVEGIVGYFIQNDSVNDRVTWNLYKNIEIPLQSLTLSADANCEISIQSKEKYYVTYSFTPHTKFTLRDNNRLIYSSKDIVNLDDIVLPTEKNSPEKLEDVLNVYMSHPMYQDKTNLKLFLTDVFSQNGLFQHLMNKSANFIDDYANVKTCYVDELLSIYSMLDEDINQYNIDSFAKVRELKELMRILSMNYTTLFGNIINDEYDISITHAYQGSNVNDNIGVSDTIYCDKKWNIIGIRKENTIYPLSEKTPFVIIKDNFSLKTHLGSFHNLISLEFDDFSDQSEKWKANNKDFISSIAHSFKIQDYDYTWGWSLNLPDEINNVANKDKIIENYYSFYLFNPAKTNKRKYNFLEESTIPLGSDGQQLSVEEWNKKFGFTYDCLMKVLVDKLVH